MLSFRLPAIYYPDPASLGRADDMQLLGNEAAGRLSRDMTWQVPKIAPTTE